MIYVRRYAYVCELGNDTDRCLVRMSSASERADVASAEIADRRAARRMSRATLVVTAAARRALAGGDGPVAELPLYVGVGTGLSSAAPMLDALARADATPENPVSAMFSGHGGNVLDYLKYSVSMVAGTIAEATGIRARNATYVGASAGFLALRAAVRFLRSGRGTQALVVSGESMLERGARPRPEQPLPREFGGALWLSTIRPGVDARAIDFAERPATQPVRFTHLEGAGALLNLTWALESGAWRDGCHFREVDTWRRDLAYGVEADKPEELR